MKGMFAATLMCVAVAMNSGAYAAPEDDRKAIVDMVQQRFPNIMFEDYVYGALAFSSDSKSQYDSVMEFPPFETEIEKSKKMWETAFNNGKKYADCFPDGGHNAAGNYPHFDEKLGKVVTFEMALNQCRAANGEPEYKYGDMATMGLLSVYARSLSDGMKMHIQVDSPGALAMYEAGKRSFFSRRGQLNFSCGSCHVTNVGKIIRTEYLSPAPGQATHWPVFRQGENLFTLQKRYAACQQMIRANPAALGSEEYNNMEYFHSYLSNGLPMKSAVFRK